MILSRPHFIAHRGFSGPFRENTEEAFRKAVEAGFDGIETDVRVTKDGVLVINHDSTVRYSDGTELEVAEHTFAELSAKPLFNPKSDTVMFLCTFERYLQICAEGGMTAVIELKGVFTEEKINEVFCMADAIHGLENCQLQSFHFENLLRAHERFPKLTIVFTCGRDHEEIELCPDLGFMIAIDQGGIDAELVARFHEKGIPIDVWTINDKEALRNMRELDIDWIESDWFSSFDALEEGKNV